MKLYIITFSLLFLVLVNFKLSSSNIIIKEKSNNSYKACIRLREKAPYFNLKCEKLKEEVVNNREDIGVKNESDDKKIRFLSSDKTETRKVNEKQENKLKIFLQKLTKENILKIKSD